MGPVTVFGGYGFVGSHFWDAHNLDEWVRNDRNDYVAHTPDVVDFISTVHNYNVYHDLWIDIDTNCRTLMSRINNWENHAIFKKTGGVYNFISSWFVYGGEPERTDVKETDYCDPKGFYSITKRCAEQLLISYCTTFGLKYRILRLGNVIGPGDKKASKQKNALQWIVNEMKEGRDIQMYDDGQYYRDYIHVEDVADAINLVIHKGEVNQIYNIGNGPTKWKFRDILYYCRHRADTGARINEIEPKTFHNQVQVKSFTMNVDKLKALGFQPRYTDEALYDSLLG